MHGHTVQHADLSGRETEVQQRTKTLLDSHLYDTDFAAFARAKQGLLICCKRR